MPGSEGNGHYGARFDRLDSEIEGIKDSLASAINDLKEAVYADQRATDGVAKELRGLATAIATWAKTAETVIPIRAVFWLFVIMVLGLIGVEGVKQISPFMKFLIGG